MKATSTSSAKILNHSCGFGAPTAEDVRKRASELAEIEGWTEPNEEHWRAAKRELHGGHEFENGSDDHDMQLLVSGPDFIASDPGSHTPRRVDDDDHVAEELIAEGMDEALHEQMLASQRAQHESAEDDDEQEEGKAL
jgi:hypothetical protein